MRKLLGVVARGKSMWEATFDAIRDPVLIIDREYTIERANRGAAGRSGHDIRHLIGKKCYRIFAKREEVCPCCPLSQTLKEKRPRSVEILSLMPAGDFQVNSYPLLRHAGLRPHKAVHHYRDITEDRRLQAKLIQSEKMAAIGMLAGGVAHEINNPLAGILAFAQILRKDLKDGSPEQADVGEIEEAARRCKKIVEDLLTFARPYSQDDKKDISLPETLDRILPLMKLNLRHQNISLVTDYAPDLPPVKGSGAKLQQVFLNLINNAAQSMTPGGGEVALQLRSGNEGREIVASVIDRGRGISKEDLPRIFDPFFTTKEKGEGTGLGLSICFSIISEHGGKINVESEVGKGSVFRVNLPAATR